MENVVEQVKPEVEKAKDAAVEEHTKLQEALHRVMLAAVGTVGLVGPTRMDYTRALAAVDVVSERLGRRLEDG